MILLGTGALPNRRASGVFQVIQYLRELTDDNSFESLPDDIIIPAIRISIPDMSFNQEIYGDEDNPIHLRILDRNERDPKVMICFGNMGSPSLAAGDSKMSLSANPFKDVKRIEEYAITLADDQNTAYTLIKLFLDRMNITFVKMNN
jgi:hypothetical protein